MPQNFRQVATAFFVCTTPLAHADTFRLATKNAAGSVEVTGTIVDYTGEKITLERTGGAPRAYPAERVVDVDTEWPKGYEAGEAALAEHDYPSAIRQFTAAARHDQRPWVRRLAMTQLMQAYTAVGDWTTAGDLLLAISRSDPTTPALDAAPLAWFPVEGVPRGKIDAWLSGDSSPAARLMGASHAMQTSLRGEALKHLRALQRSGDPRIAFLARAQSWRAAIVTAKRADIDRWETILRDSPERLRAGAWFVVGEARRQQRQHDAAVLAYLRVPLLFPEHRQLAARALWEAAQAAQSAGRQDESAQIAQELIRDYAETPPAHDARAMLQSAHESRATSSR